MSLRNEVKSENNTPFTIEICCVYNNVAITSWLLARRTEMLKQYTIQHTNMSRVYNAANTSRISANDIVLQAHVRAHLRSQYRAQGQSIAEETIAQTFILVLLRRHYCKPRANIEDRKRPPVLFMKL